jgi:hypothetical protein
VLVGLAAHTVAEVVVVALGLLPAAMAALVLWAL